MSRTFFLTLISLTVLVIVSGCASTGTTVPADTQETLIWSSAAERPNWTVDEPETVNGTMSFVGVSGKYSTEKGAREDARRNASSAVTKYMGTLVKDKFEQVKTSFGLESDVIDPTSATNEFQKQMSVNMANKVKMSKWYIEKWRTPTGTAHIIYVLAKVPESAVDESYKNTAKQMVKKAERQAKEAGDAHAKDQAQKAADFWKQMQERGVTE